MKKTLRINSPFLTWHDTSNDNLNEQVVNDGQFPARIYFVRIETDKYPLKKYWQNIRYAEKKTKPDGVNDFLKCLISKSHPQN